MQPGGGSQSNVNVTNSCKNRTFTENVPYHEIQADKLSRFILGL
jgi:hypothetical protein